MQVPREQERKRLAVFVESAARTSPLTSNRMKLRMLMETFRRGGRVVMQRTATPCTPVRFRPAPPFKGTTMPYFPTQVEKLVDDVHGCTNVTGAGSARVTDVHGCTNVTNAGSVRVTARHEERSSLPHLLRNRPKLACS